MTEDEKIIDNPTSPDFLDKITGDVSNAAKKNEEQLVPDQQKSCEGKPLLTDSTAVNEGTKVEKTTEIKSIQETSLIEIGAIKEGPKIRKKISLDTVTKMASAYQAKATIPPLTLQKGTNVLVDGIIRLAALILLGLTHIEVIYIEIEDCDLYAKALELNKANGKQLTKAEQNIAIYNLRRDGKRTWDDIGRILGFSASTVHERYISEISKRGINDPYDGRRIVSERQVMDLAGKGWTQGAIAVYLSISQPRVSQILKKFRKNKRISMRKVRPNPDMIPKQRQINNIKKRIQKISESLPPNFDVDKIVVEDIVDGHCSQDQNMQNLTDNHPDLVWKFNQPPYDLELEDSYPVTAKLNRSGGRVFYKISIPKKDLEQINHRLPKSVDFKIPIPRDVDTQEAELRQEKYAELDRVFGRDARDKETEWLLEHIGSTPMDYVKFCSQELSPEELESKCLMGFDAWDAEPEWLMENPGYTPQDYVKFRSIPESSEPRSEPSNYSSS